MQKKGPSDIQIRTEQRQQSELAKLSAQEAQRTRAAGRRTRGRASLISGSERGMGDTGFEAKNVATQERLGTEASLRSTAEGKRRQSLLQTEQTAESVRKKKKATEEAGHYISDPAWGTARATGLISF